MTTVKNGSKGSEVTTLQGALNKVGGYGLVVDGIFGPKTESAVKDYQKKHDLSVDGIVGPKTWSSLGYATEDTPTAGGRAIDLLIVHCSATIEGNEYSSKTISDWHKARNFSYYKDTKTGEKRYVGYHYIIHLDGTIEPCRPESVRGCHVSNYNAKSIGICYIGGYDKNKKAIDTRTPEQKASLLKLLKELKGRYPKATVHGHREYAAKACPCFDAKKEYANI